MISHVTSLTLHKSLVAPKSRRYKLRSLDKPDELGAIALEVFALRMARTVKNPVE